MPTITWTNSSGDANWNNTANWDLGRAPASGDDVIIAGPVAPNYYIAPATALTLNSLDTTSVTDSNGFDLNNPGTLTNAMTIAGGGTLSMGNPAAVHYWSGNASAAASCSFNYGSHNENYTGPGTVFNNSAMNDNVLAGTVQGDATFLNGSLNLGIVAGDAAFQSGSQNSGNVTGNVTLDGASSMYSGTVNGNATVGVTSGDNSFIVGGNVVGTTTFRFNSQLAGGTLAAAIFGASSGDAPSMVSGIVTDAATFNQASTFTGGNCNANVNWNSSVNAISATAALISIGYSGGATFTAGTSVEFDFSGTFGLAIASDLAFAVTGDAVITEKTGSLIQQLAPHPADLHPVNQDTGGTDNLRYVDSTGIGVDQATILIYAAADWPENPDNVAATSATRADGRWTAPAYVPAGTFIAVFTKPGADGPDASPAFTI